MENAQKRIRLQKIVSGGQTGVDRAALDAALAAGQAVGGWCPAGRRAEDGVIAARYPLQETPSVDYAQRTAWNVRDSDGTLVLIADTPAGGTALTLQEAKRQGKALLVVDLHAPPEISAVADWLATHEITVLNVAGPRESEAPGIYGWAKAFMEMLLG
ncbi:MAG TPA: putative molybdenum carrier protein [Rhodothermales bacterium]|nr:putative molybdenum carrier protein [Rhodothermales bacterium]